MNDFKKNSFSHSGGGRPSFGGGFKARHSSSRPGPRRFDEPMEMHKTNCSKCNNPCEVPFRPNGKKPVFCKDCFVRDEERAAPSFQKSRFSSDRGERSFGGDRSYNAPQASSEDPRISAIQKELKGVQAKLDTILEYLEEAA